LNESNQNNKISSVKKNAFYQTIYQLLISLLPLVLAPYVSRVLGANNIGIYSYTFSVTTYFMIFALLGISHHGSRTIATVRSNKEKLNRVFSNLFFLHLCVSLVILVTYIGFIYFFAGEHKLLFIIQTGLVLSALFDITWLFSGLEQFKLIVTRNAIIKIITVACVFIFVKDENDLWKYILILTLGTFAGQAVAWFFIKRFISFIKPTWNEVKKHIKPILILFIPVIATSVYNVMNKIILSAMTDNIQLGFFENSFKTISIPISIILAFNSVLIPRISALNASGKEAEKERLTLVSMKYVMLLAFAMTFGISAIAHDFSPLFFGLEFKDCGALIAILCISIPFLAFSNTIASQYIVPNLKDKTYSFAVVMSAIANVIANIILIPKYEAVGAAIGVIIAEIVRCIIMSIASRKALSLLIYIKNSMFFIIIGIFMYFIVRFIAGFMTQIVISLLVQVVIGVVFYLGASAIYLYKTKDEFFLDNSQRIINIIKRK
jgi:O-antigen/teichoic acid export membrane protein